jgi:hypothetical protein
MNKRGISNKNGGVALSWKQIIFFAVICLALGLSIHYHQTCKITPEDLLTASNGSNLQYTKNWVKEHIFFCEKETPGIIENPTYWIKETLNFNKGILDFIPDLVTGALVGLWIFLIFVLARLEMLFALIPVLKSFTKNDYAKLQSGWLGFIGGKVWKIIPIAVGYAVLMQIPIINSFIQVITLEPLLGLKSTIWIWNSFIKSFILAFYIGFAPAAIEGYTRYKLKKRYMYAITRVKYEGELLDQLAKKR